MPRGRHFFGRGFWWRGIGLYPYFYPYALPRGGRGFGRFWFGMPPYYAGGPYGPVNYYPYGIAPYPF